MSLPITVTPLDDGAYRVKVEDGSSGLTHSAGVPVIDAASAVAVVKHLLGIESIESPSEGPWRASLDAMCERMSSPSLS